MKKPDPTRFTGKSKTSGDSLEMKGFSTTPLEPPTEKSHLQEEESYNRTNVRVYDRTHERTDVRKEKRVRIRHAFDIFEDQLRSMHRLQLEAVQDNKNKPKLGEMVQRALDMYMKKKEEERTSGRTNESSNERSNDRI